MGSLVMNLVESTHLCELLKCTCKYISQHLTSVIINLFIVEESQKAYVCFCDLIVKLLDRESLKGIRVDYNQT